jgi:Protein of unknown function (DUF3300)
MNAIGRKLKRKQKVIRYLIAFVCAILLLPGNAILLARAGPTPGPTPLPQDTSVKIPADQLDSLVAPIALYPDNLLSQTLVASTYPLEIIQLQQWLDKHQDLASNQQKLAEAVKKQPWDSSIQAMAALPDVVKRLADDIQWTTDLGNAFLAQPSDVMDAIQRMRKKAQDKGALQSNYNRSNSTSSASRGASSMSRGGYSGGSRGGFSGGSRGGGGFGGGRGGGGRRR